MPKTLHLASASPRRRDILEALRLDFTAEGVDLDETPLPDEDPADMVLRLAAAKSAAAAVRADVVLGADTAVVVSGRSLGKPATRDAALEMLDALSGVRHEVLTGVAVRSSRGLETALSRSVVQFRDIDPAEAAHYWQSGEPRDKAGAYAIQGLGGLFVVRLEGSYSGVVGLPVCETGRLLRNAGINVLGRMVSDAE